MSWHGVEFQKTTVAGGPSLFRCGQQARLFWSFPDRATFTEALMLITSRYGCLRSRFRYSACSSSICLIAFVSALHFLIIFLILSAAARRSAFPDSVFFGFVPSVP